MLLTEDHQAAVTRRRVLVDLRRTNTSESNHKPLQPHPMSRTFPRRSVLIALWAMALYPVFTFAQNPAAPTASYRSVLRCGPNAAFLFLLLSGHSDVSLDQIDDLLVPDDPLAPFDGTSLLSVRDVILRFQADVEVRRYQPEQIDMVSLPAIVLFRSGGVDAISSFHYNIIYKLDRNRVFLIDGTSARRFSILRSRLGIFWTGIALSRIDPSGGRWTSLSLQLMSAVIVTCVLCYYCVLPGLAWVIRGQWRAKTSKARGAFTERSWLIALVISLSLISSRSTRAADSISSPWRSPTNGGVNVLFCYLRTNGRDCDYSELLKQHGKNGGGPSNAVSLARLAANYSVSLEPKRLTVKELSSAPMPVIVHVDGDSPEAGAFLLLLQISGGTIYYVNGPTAAISVMQSSDFRRIWSGVALLPSSDRIGAILAYFTGFGLGLLAATHRLLGRRRSLSHVHGQASD
jgi:hypothetical protein